MKTAERVIAIAMCVFLIDLHAQQFAQSARPIYAFAAFVWTIYALVQAAILVGLIKYKP